MRLPSPRRGGHQKQAPPCDELESVTLSPVSLAVLRQIRRRDWTATSIARPVQFRIIAKAHRTPATGHLITRRFRRGTLGAREPRAYRSSFGGPWRSPGQAFSHQQSHAETGPDLAAGRPLICSMDSLRRRHPTSNGLPLVRPLNGGGRIFALDRFGRALASTSRRQPCRATTNPQGRRRAYQEGVS